MAKKPAVKSLPHPSKTPAVFSNPERFWDQRPSWRISILEMHDVYGWHAVDRATIDRVYARLKNFETMTWREILIKGIKQSHFIPTWQLCPTAKARLNTLQLDDYEKIVSLHVTGLERIFGFLDNAVLQLLWWDPEHKVCPS